MLSAFLGVEKASLYRKSSQENKKLMDSSTNWDDGYVKEWEYRIVDALADLRKPSPIALYGR